MSGQKADQDREQLSRAKMRTVVFHYHLFKNAGTSLDALFRQHFGERWVTSEFPGQTQANLRGQLQWIEEHPEAACFSSHTALLTRHSLPDVRVVPVIFVRHPLDRIASAYSFESQQKDPSFGATLARNTSLRGYVETRLSIRQDRQCRNFHVSRFAAMFREESDSELAAALQALEALPFVGIVEDFSESLKRLQGLLRAEGFEDIALQPIQRNVSAGRPASLHERLDRMAEEVGASCYESLLEANEEDLAFYDAAVKVSARVNATASSAIARLPVMKDAERMNNHLTICQFWDTKPPPPYIAKFVKTWSSQNPGAQHLLYSDESAREFLRDVYGISYANVFSACTVPAMRADLFRYFHLYAMGGIYVDASTRCLAPISSWLPAEDKPVFIEKPNRIINGFLYSPAKEIVLERIINQALENIRNLDSSNIWLLTGPGCVATVFRKDPELLDRVALIGFRDFLKKVDVVNDAAHKKDGQHWSLVQDSAPLFNSAIFVPADLQQRGVTNTRDDGF